MFKIQILHLSYFLCVFIYYSEINGYKDDEILHHSEEFENCICLRWTDWISLGDAKHVARSIHTYADLIELGKLAAAYEQIDTCTVPVSSDCRVLVTDHQNQDDDRYLVCPYVRNERGTESGFTQMRFLCWDHTCPCLQWSNWYNRDGPRDDGDIEILSKTIPSQDWPCSDGTGILDVECRTVDGKSMTDTTNRMLQCDLDGFRCLNDMQDTNCVCEDFMVRFLCLKRLEKSDGSKTLPLFKRHLEIEENDTSPESEALDFGKFDTVENDPLAKYEVENFWPAQNLDENLKCFASPNKCWPTIDVDREEAAAPNATSENKDLEAIEKAVEEFESEAKEKFDSFTMPTTPASEIVLEHFEESERPVESSTAKPEIYDLDIRNLNRFGSKHQATEHPQMAAVIYDSILDRPSAKKDPPHKQNKDIEIFRTEDGRELMIEAVASKTDKSPGQVSAPDTDRGRKPFFRPHSRKDFDEVRHQPPAPYRRYIPPMHHRPMPYFQNSRNWHEYPPRQSHHWRRPHPEDDRHPPRIDPHNYDVGYEGVDYDPRTGQLTRYRVSESRRGHQSRRSWSKPVRHDLRSYPERRQ